MARNISQLYLLKSLYGKWKQLGLLTPRNSSLCPDSIFDRNELKRRHSNPKTRSKVDFSFWRGDSFGLQSLSPLFSYMLCCLSGDNFVNGIHVHRFIPSTKNTCHGTHWPGFRRSFIHIEVPLVLCSSITDSCPAQLNDYLTNINEIWARKHHRVELYRLRLFDSGWLALHRITRLARLR